MPVTHSSSLAENAIAPVCTPKLCVCDHFVRNGVLQETLPLDPESLKNCDEAVSTQVGCFVERVLGYFLKGIPGIELSWFPERAKESEVDLVLTIGAGRIPVEVKYRRVAPDKASPRSKSCRTSC